MHPYLLMLPATLAASCGFMLPIATPPNAIAIASGYVTTPQMVRAGIVLDLIGALLITAFVALLGRPVFGLP
ncbi:MAG: anion permease [Armatimonadota bacterium]|nr:anion permease [Armatimonadota bacterium]